MKFRDSKRTITLLSVVSLLVVVGLTGYISVGATQRSIAAPMLANCGNGIPAEKCNPSLYKPYNLAPPAQPIHALGPYWPSSSIVNCGPTFFSQSTALRLTQQFGTIRCFKFQDKPTWIVTGDGSSSDGQSASRGGAMIALESCDTALVNCMNPDSLHDFGSFTVSYPPLPSSYPTIMEGTFGSRLLYISDAYCGLYTFDTSTGKWYGNKPTDIDSLMSGDEQVATVPTPPTFAGDLAMQISAPAGQGVCNGSIK